MKIIDLTHTFTSSMPVFPGDAPAALERLADPEPEVAHFHLDSGLHVGTHMDAPLHMIPNGKKLSEYPPEKFIANGHLIDARGMKEIEEDMLQNLATARGDAVLVFTGWDKRFHDPSFYHDYPTLTEGFARELVKRRVGFVGMDMPSPDRSPYAVHRILLTADVLIIESMCALDALLDAKRFEVIALPAKLEAEAAPARVVARIAA